MVDNELFVKPKESFFLRSTSNTVVTNGCFARINVPAADGADLDGEFQTAIKAAFEDARAAGIEKPIVVGAIPFDPSQPSALYIPERSQFFEQDKKFGTAHAQDLQTPQVTSSQFLPEHDEFTGMVQDAVDAICAKKLQKVVLSRLQDVHTSEPVNSRDLLAKIIAQNPVGFNFHVPLANGDCLIGSSPELLVSKHGDQFFSKPLAGSAGRDPKNDKAVAQTLLDSPKDRHEHKLVVDSMRATLAPRAAELHIPVTPECICTPKLWHLATPIDGTVANKQETALSLAALLHPTPALSGFPHAIARDLLVKLEPFDREYFGGIVGYCDSEGNGEWFIAIRCGKVEQDRIRLFAGAGIVGDSSPESEWRETGIKLGTMQQAFNIN